MVKNMVGIFVRVETLLDVLDSFFMAPFRDISAEFRLPLSGIYKIKGVGDVLTGRVEQGIFKPGQEVIFLPSHSSSRTCSGKIFSIEMHHVKSDHASSGDNVGINVKGLEKTNMPKIGDIMISKQDTTIKTCSSFIAQVQTLDNIPNNFAVGYCPIGFVRCGRSACQIRDIIWKAGKETNGRKMMSPVGFRSNEMGEVLFKPCNALVVEAYKDCVGLSRIAFLEGNLPVMLGKILRVEH